MLYIEEVHYTCLVFMMYTSYLKLQETASLHLPYDFNTEQNGRFVTNLTQKYETKQHVSHFLSYVFVLRNLWIPIAPKKPMKLGRKLVKSLSSRAVRRWTHNKTFKFRESTAVHLQAHMANFFFRTKTNTKDKLKNLFPLPYKFIAEC